MSGIIGPGSVVQFVGPDNPQWPTGLTLNALYRVKEVSIGRMRCATCKTDSLLVLTYRTGWNGYCPCVFKPIDGDAKSVADLLALSACEAV